MNGDARSFSLTASAVRVLFCGLVVGPALHVAAQTAQPVTPTEWRKLDTVPYKGKQDDIFFASEKVGWYGNGKGKLYKTVDGGEHWDLQWDEPGTFIRALGFVDERVGILGNVGTDYFPPVTDETPLYRTVDGGDTWNPVVIKGPQPKGICAIDVFRKPFINHGVLGYRTTIRAGGRVGGPAFLLRSDDEGLTWTSQDLSSVTGMILDVKFVSDKVGFIAGGTLGDVDKSHALVLRTGDGGKTWQRVYESAHQWQITWKLSFPTEQVGYATIQDYDPDESNKTRVVAKTTDGGLHWTELPVAEDHGLTEFGIGFLDAQRGWLGGMNKDYETFDGGKTWSPVDFGSKVNKIRIMKSGSSARVYAIGSSVYTRTVGVAAAEEKEQVSHDLKSQGLKE
jgi:photosystem II stability/assembly factor-like uncharacterized protein